MHHVAQKCTIADSEPNVCAHLTEGMGANTHRNLHNPLLGVRVWSG